jgi:hypothetical protein
MEFYSHLKRAEKEGIEFPDELKRPPNGWHQVRLRVHGPQFWFEVDDKEWLRRDTNDWTSGRLFIMAPASVTRYRWAGSPTVQGNAPPVVAPRRPVAEAPAAKGPDEAFLNSRGLTLTGANFVVASETEFLEKVETIRPLINEMAKAFGEHSLVLQNEADLAGGEEYLNSLNARIDAVNAVLAKIPNGSKSNSMEKQAYQETKATVDGLVQQRDDASGMVDALRAQQVSPEDKEKLATEFLAKRSDFLKATAELRPVYDKAISEYNKLQEDPAVKDALAAYKLTTKSAAAPGPSKNFQKAFALLRDAEWAYSPETAAAKAKAKRKARKP